MAEIYLDNKLWKRIYKLLDPDSEIWVRENKGGRSSSGGCLIPSRCVIALSEASIARGSVISELARECWNRHFKTLPLENVLRMWAGNPHGLNQSIRDRVEIGIIRAAIDTGLLSEGVLYDGGLLETEKKEDSKILQLSGFVYLIRSESIYKIGITDNLMRRMGELRPDEVVSAVRCENYQELEKDLHRHFKKLRLPQSEYFRLSSNEVAEAMQLMMKGARLGSTS